MAIKISREDLDEYARLNGERRALERQARTLGERCKEIEAAVLQQMKASGKQIAKRYDYTLALIDGRATVAWKDEYIKAFGIEAATELQSQAVAPQKVTITAPSE